MADIRILPTELVNKIAAGEVIERPASIVKELVENALDARAAQIDISVEDGGKRLIRVADDGAGMSSEDAALAFRPHATSKIATDENLFAIETLGFRGEALASVASVSHAHLRTRRADDEAGSEVTASGGDLSRPRPCPAAPGTTVTIRDLFFNTPARRKFLRTPNTELGHIAEQVVRASVPRPDVAFTLTHNARQVHNLPAVASTTARIADLFAADLADSLLPIVARSGPTGVAGLIGRPAASRASGKWQYFFLNGRFIRDRILGHALREAYRGLIDPGRWCVAFVFLTVDPAEVDVNVHPTKIEVRFRDSQMVHGELLAALRETLNRADLTPAAALDEPSGATRQDPTAEMRRQSLREAIADFFKSKSSGSPPQGRMSPAPRETSQRSAPQGVDPSRALGALAAREPPAPVPATAQGQYLTDEPPATVSAAGPKAIQIHNSYIVTADDEGLIIVDQHALHERLIYNDLTRRLGDGELTGQRLLIPQTFSASPAEADALVSAGETLGRLGIEVASFGPGTLAVQRFPTLLVERGVSPVEFMREMLDGLAEGWGPDQEQLLEELLSMMACKAAVKAGEKLGEMEIDDLLARRQQADKSSSCPHGRPTTLKLTLPQLTKQFKRT